MVGPTYRAISLRFTLEHIPCNLRVGLELSKMICGRTGQARATRGIGETQASGREG